MNECRLWLLYTVSTCLVAKSYPTLCDSMDCGPPGSSVHGISQARILERVPIPFSKNLPDPGIESVSPALQADSLPLSHLGSQSQVNVGGQEKADLEAALFEWRAEVVKE